MKLSAHAAALGFVVVLAVGAAGCSGTVGKDIDPGHVWRVAEPLPITVAVVRFSDARPAEEREHVHKYLKHFDYTHDELYDRAVAAAIARATAEQLAMAGVFQDCAYVDLDWPELKAQGLSAGTTPAGVDFVLTAQVKHFVGWRELNVLRSLILLPAGIYGTAAGVVLGNDAGAKVELAEVRLEDARTGEVVWEGECESHFEERQRMVDTAADNANSALREAVNGLAKRMYEGVAGLTPKGAQAEPARPSVLSPAAAGGGMGAVRGGEFLAPPPKGPSR